MIDLLIPTWNNNEYLIPCLNSLSGEEDIQVFVVNNGDAENMEGVEQKNVTVLQQSMNLGWEGGLKKGLEASKSELVVFLNDDTYTPRSSHGWMSRLRLHFLDSKVGAVGPSTNVVMGAQQIFAPIDHENTVFKVKFLIGFCMMVRRSALEEAGGVDDRLSGGDDFDLSIRLRKAGYDLLVDRNEFVYHHGFKTGERIHGNAASGGWNSMDMIERTNFGLINKHGLRPWLDCMQNQMAV